MSLPSNHPAAVDLRWTRLAGFAVAERCAGSGPPIVFVHGLAVSSRYFVPLIRELADRHACRAVDLPGFGDSDKPPRVLSVTGLANALAAWLRANDLTGAALVGNSAGCQYIVECVTRHRDVTGPLVLIGPTVDPRNRFGPEQAARLLACGFSADITMLPILAGDARKAGLSRLAGTLHSVLDDAIEAKLPAVTQPALVLRGVRDALVPAAWIRRVAALLPRSRLVEVSGAAHAVHYTHPAAVAREVAAFLHQTTGGPPA